MKAKHDRLKMECGGAMNACDRDNVWLCSGRTTTVIQLALLKNTEALCAQRVTRAFKKGKLP
jgi:hypothetical protein